MKKTKVGQGRKLLLRGEIVARLAQEDLHLVAGGDQPSVIASFTEPKCTSHPSTFA